MMTAGVAAASPIQATFQGVNGAEAFGYYVGPYYGQLGSNIVPLYCDDFANDVTFNQTWMANLSTITDGSDLSATRYGAEPDALTSYQEIAWLDSQYAGQPKSQYADIQATVWQIFDPAQAPKPSSDYWLKEAELNYRQIAFDDFRIVTNVGPVMPTGQVQEFITVVPQNTSRTGVPEPASLFLIGGGLAGGSLFLKRFAKKP